MMPALIEEEGKPSPRHAPPTRRGPECAAQGEVDELRRTEATTSEVAIAQQHAKECGDRICGLKAKQTDARSSSPPSAPSSMQAENARRCW